MPAPKGEGRFTLGGSGVNLSSNHGDGLGYAVQSTLNTVWREPEGLSVAHRGNGGWRDEQQGWGAVEGGETTMV